MPHGVACAALLAPVIEANVRALRSGPPVSRALARYAEAARLLTGAAGRVRRGRPGLDPRDGRLLAIPGLAAFGLRPAARRRHRRAGRRGRAACRATPSPLTDDDLRAIVLAAL